MFCYSGLRHCSCHQVCTLQRYWCKLFFTGAVLDMLLSCSCGVGDWGDVIGGGGMANKRGLGAPLTCMWAVHSTVACAACCLRHGIRVSCVSALVQRLLHDVVRAHFDVTALAPAATAWQACRPCREVHDGVACSKRTAGLQRLISVHY